VSELHRLARMLCLELSDLDPDTNIEGAPAWAHFLPIARAKLESLNHHAQTSPDDPVPEDR
jgi:hypothetical protein